MLTALDAIDNRVMGWMQARMITWSNPCLQRTAGTAARPEPPHAGSPSDQYLQVADLTLDIHTRVVQRAGRHY